MSSFAWKCQKYTFISKIFFFYNVLKFLIVGRKESKVLRGARGGESGGTKTEILGSWCVPKRTAKLIRIVIVSILKMQLGE